MASLFTNWIGSKLTGEGEQGPSDPAHARATGSGSTSMSPIDRATSMTPKAPFQFGSSLLSDWTKSDRDHHREASEATLNGRASETGASDTPASTLHPSTAGLVKPKPSRPNSMAIASDLSTDGQTAFSSTLGGVDSEAAWSAAPTSDINRQSLPRRRKKVAPPELLVIVKPPPSKQVNPLNLQIQLVMPQQLQNRRDGSARRSSMDSSATPGDVSGTPSNELRRRDSIASTRSAGSEISTANSVASANAARRVTPLYNLNFHSILSTTVSDAGTDQKVAKYTKKGIDLDGFGIIEPAELVNGVNDIGTLYRNAIQEGGGSETVHANIVKATSPRSEADSSGSVDDVSAFSAPARDAAGPTGAPSDVEPPTSFQAMTPEARGAEANLGGKLLGRFKRFSINVRPNSSAGPATSTATQDRATGLVGSTPQVATATAPGSSSIPQLTPGAAVVDGKRSEGYYWTVRKWNRKAQDGVSANFAGRSSAVANASTDLPGSNAVLNSVWKRFNLVNRLGGSEVHPPTSQIPVRFEWSRNSKKLHNRRRTEEAQARIRASTSLNASTTSLHRQSEGDKSIVSLSARPLGVEDASAPRLSTGDGLRSSSRPSSFISGHHSPPRASMDTSAAGSSAPHGEDDSGDESDPEDSETPWNCHLVLGPTTRIPLGTLSPAPHHPKLVGQLAVPFPLPDLSGTGLGPDGAGLTREELKDVIIVTCLHLIVRESFGGLARRRSNGSVDPGHAVSAASNVSGWRLAAVPKKQ